MTDEQLDEMRRRPGARQCVDELVAEVRRLQAHINNPHNEDWLEGVRIEAAHQQASVTKGESDAFEHVQ